MFYNFLISHFDLDSTRWWRPHISPYLDEMPNMCPDAGIVILKILRNFGHIVLDIFLKYEEEANYQFKCHIESYLALYCSNSLTNLKLIVRPAILFDRSIQFINLKNIDILESKSLTVGAVPFEGCFPNLRSLKWDPSTQMLPITVVEVPSLDHVNIMIGICISKCCCEKIIQLLRLNPQLTKLEFQLSCYKCNIELLPRVRDYLPKLEVLSLTGVGYECFVTNEIVHFENVVELKLNLFRHKIIPLTFGRLKSLCVRDSSRTQSTVSDFIAKNEHLKILHIYHPTDTSSLTGMISVLSNRVEDLTITQYYMPPSSVILSLLTKIQSLKKLSLVARHYSDSGFSDLVRAKISKQEKRGDFLYVTFHQ